MRAKNRLTAEQVAQVIAANRLLPDPPGGFDMQGIADELNNILAAPAPASGRDELLAAVKIGLKAAKNAVFTADLQALRAENPYLRAMEVIDRLDPETLLYGKHP